VKFLNKKTRLISHSRRQLNDFLKNLEVKADRVRDIGGGNKFTQFRGVKKWDVNETECLDIDRNSDPDYLADLNDDLAKNPNIEKLVNCFDIVFCFETMQYIWNPYQAHQNIFNFLKQGGISYISYHFLYPIHNPLNSDYLRYTKEGIKKLATQSGFSSCELTPRIAGENQSTLKSFFKKEKMQAHFNLPETYNTGYIAKLTK